MYEYAQEKQIPVLTHCTKGGIFYQGKNLTPEQVRPVNLNTKPIHDHDYSADLQNKQSRKNRHFKNHFNHPRNYDEVLAVYPELKICIAHYGGSSEMLKYLDAPEGQKPANNWYKFIRDLIARPNNVYTDISYTLAEDRIFETLRNDIRDPAIGKKLLFGTDYFMTIQEKDEESLVNDFVSTLTREEFEMIAGENVERYLEMK